MIKGTKQMTKEEENFVRSFQILISSQNSEVSEEFKLCVNDLMRDL